MVLMVLHSGEYLYAVRVLTVSRSAFEKKLNWSQSFLRGLIKIGLNAHSKYTEIHIHPPRAVAFCTLYSLVITVLTRLTITNDISHQKGPRAKAADMRLRRSGRSPCWNAL